MASHHGDAEWHKLASLPAGGCQSSQAIFSAKTTAGRLTILQRGAAAIIQEAIEIAGRSNPNAVFSELFIRQDWGDNLNAFGSSEFCVNDAAERSGECTIPLILVTTVWAQRREGSNFAVRPTTGLRATESGAAINQSVGETNNDSGNLIYAGYPYDPFK